MPSRKIDENGVEINTDAKGNTTRTYPDGATEYYNAATGVTTLLRANGNIVVTQSSGVSRETWATPKANGEENYITRNADGSYNEVSVETDEYKMWLDDNGTLVTEYKKPQKNDLILKREYKNGDLEEEFAGGKRVRYDSTGVEIASYDADPSGKFGIYSYTDRIETVLANGKTKSIEYIAGLYAGAKIEYDPLDEGVRSWWERQCAWTVTSARGGVTRCYVEEIDGVKCSVICFAGGLTCTRPSEEVDATYFKYESSLGGAPSGYLYDAKPRVVTMWETKTDMGDGTTRYRRTDGSVAFYADVHDGYHGGTMNALMRYVALNGSQYEYDANFYAKIPTSHEIGELLWTATTANGDVTTARAYGNGDDRLVLFFAGENAGKSRTLKISDADPENYIESAGADSYDIPVKVLPMPELGVQDTPDGGVMQTYTDGKQRITYSNGNSGELSRGNNTYTVKNKNGMTLYELTLRDDGTGRAFYPILKGEDAGESVYDYYEIYRDGKVIQRNYTARLFNNNYYGAIIDYGDAYYQEVSARKSGDLLWTVKAKSGAVTKCYVISDGKNDAAVLYNDMTYNVWPTATEQAPTPENYLSASSPEKDSFKTSVTGDLAELIPALASK